MTTQHARRLAAQLMRGLWPKYPNAGFDDHDGYRRRLRETEDVITALYAHTASTEPDVAILAAQMLEDEGHSAAADLVRQLFPPGEDPAPPGERTLAALHTGRFAAVVTMRPRGGR